MIIVKSGYRVSLLGGSTDYNEYLQENKYGMCIGFAIDKYSCVTVQSVRDYSRIIYSETETVKDNRLIEHKAIKAAILQAGLVDTKMEITHLSDLRGNCGLGTSSSMIASLVQALNILKNQTEFSTIDLIKNTVAVEQSYSTVGWQDATLSVFGGLSTVIFQCNNNDVFINRYGEPKRIRDEFEKYGLLFYTGESRNASAIAGSYLGNLAHNPCVKDIYKLAEQGCDLLFDGKFDIFAFGELIIESWHLKKQISPAITTPLVEQLEYELVNAGCFAFRLMGAGGGGTIFCLAEPEMHHEVIQAATRLGCEHIPFKITEGGTEVLSK